MLRFKQFLLNESVVTTGVTTPTTGDHFKPTYSNPAPPPTGVPEFTPRVPDWARDRFPDEVDDEDLGNPDIDSDLPFEEFMREYEERNPRPVRGENESDEDYQARVRIWVERLNEVLQNYGFPNLNDPQFQNDLNDMLQNLDDNATAAEILTAINAFLMARLAAMGLGSQQIAALSAQFALIAEVFGIGVLLAVILYGTYQNFTSPDFDTWIREYPLIGDQWWRDFIRDNGVGIDDIDFDIGEFLRNPGGFGLVPAQPLTPLPPGPIPRKPNPDWDDRLRQYFPPNIPNMPGINWTNYQA
jgi:hypothetical protein